MQEQHGRVKRYERNIYNYRGPGQDGQRPHRGEDALGISGERRSYDVLITRDRGKSISEAIPRVILNKDFTEMGYMTETLLYLRREPSL